MNTDPEDCQTMQELRELIDAIDRDLVALLARRAACIDRAVAIKAGAGLPARIDDRVREVLDRVEAAAAGQGLESDIVRRVWTELIEWSIAREERVLGRDGERGE